MKTIILLGSKLISDKNDPNAVNSVFVEKLAGKHDIRQVNFEDLVINVSDSGVLIHDSVSGANIKDCDLVIALNWYLSTNQAPLRDIALSVANYLSSHKVKFWNSEMAEQRSTTKISSTVTLALNGFKVPKTIFSLNKTALTNETNSALQFPVICKAASASRGEHNFKVSSQAQLQEILNSSKRAMIIQEFIPNDYDLRIICFAGQPKLVIKRSRQNDQTHLNNTSQGGSAEIIELAKVEAGVLTNAQKISKIMHRELAGIDFIIDPKNNEAICLEVNSIPQLTSGSFVSQKLDEFAHSTNEFLADESRQ